MLEKKREDKETLNAKSKKAPALPEGSVVDLGKKESTGNGKQGKSTVTPIDKITDVEILHKMMRETNSRGKKQRIKKRIEFLGGGSKKKDQQ